MKRFTNLSVFALMVFLLASCAGPEGEKVEANAAQDVQTETAEAVSYAVDVAASSIGWVGAKVGNVDLHDGTISLSEGSLSVTDGNITGGSFTIDMATINNTDLAEKPKKKGYLEGHLKSGDFFDVEKYPTAKFEITGAAPFTGEVAEGEPKPTHEITGNLTLKEVTKSITIKAMVDIAEGTITATSTSFIINRSDWGVDHDNLKDKAISDEIALTVALSAATGATAPEATQTTAE